MRFHIGLHCTHWWLTRLRQSSLLALRIQERNTDPFSGNRHDRSAFLSSTSFWSKHEFSNPVSPSPGDKSVCERCVSPTSISSVCFPLGRHSLKTVAFQRKLAGEFLLFGDVAVSFSFLRGWSGEWLSSIDHLACFLSLPHFWWVAGSISVALWGRLSWVRTQRSLATQPRRQRGDRKLWKGFWAVNESLPRGCGINGKKSVLVEGLVTHGVLPPHWVLERSARTSRQTQNFLMERRNKALGGTFFSPVCSKIIMNLNALKVYKNHHTCSTLLWRCLGNLYFS